MGGEEKGWDIKNMPPCDFTSPFSLLDLIIFFYLPPMLIVLRFLRCHLLLTIVNMTSVFKYFVHDFGCMSTKQNIKQK